MARAKANCTCKKCGKVFEVIRRDMNSRTAADHWKAWAVENITMCPDCKQQERQEAAAALVKEAKEAGAVALIGSEKQVAWAEKIRAEFLAYAKERLQATLSKASTPEIAEAATTRMESVLDWIRFTKDRASWWIDNRYDNNYLLRQLVKEYAANQAKAAEVAPTEKHER